MLMPWSNTTTHRIPPLSRAEPPRGVRGRALDRAVARCNVRERLVPRLVQPRVQEPQRRAPLRQQPIVDQRNNRAHRGARGARACQDGEPALRDDEVVRLSGEVGERAPAGVEPARVPVLATVRGEPYGDGCVLVGRAGVVVGEAAAGVDPGFLGGEALRAADGGYAESGRVSTVMKITADDKTAEMLTRDSRRETSARRGFGSSGCSPRRCPRPQRGSSCRVLPIVRMPGMPCCQTELVIS